ncbi:MAG: hypothetical protein AAGA27_04980, partial [Pseudomonadota bacterium]
MKIFEKLGSVIKTENAENEKANIEAKTELFFDCIVTKIDQVEIFWIHFNFVGIEGKKIFSIDSQDMAEILFPDVKPSFFKEINDVLNNKNLFNKIVLERNKAIYKHLPGDAHTDTYSILITKDQVESMLKKVQPSGRDQFLLTFYNKLENHAIFYNTRLAIESGFAILENRIIADNNKCLN